MERDGCERLKAIVLEATKRTGSERAAYLDEASRGDADLRSEVEALLAQGSEPIRVLRAAGIGYSLIDGQSTPATRAVRCRERLGGPLQSYREAA